MLTPIRYRKQNSDGWKLRVYPEYADPEFTALCCCEDRQTHPAFETLRNNRNTQLCRMVWNGRVFYCKEFKSPTRWRQLRKWFRPFHQIRIVAALQRRGLGCPAVFCIGHKGLRAFCVYEGISTDGHSAEVYGRIIQGLEKRISEKDFLYQFGRFTGTMHRKRVAHGDYQWGNVLVQFTGKGLRFVLIDNDRTSTLTGRIYWYRMRNLIQLIRAAGYVPASSWPWFWNGYAEGYPGIRYWRPAIEQYVMKRVARRRQASAVRKGNK